MISCSFGPFPDVGAPDWTMKLNKASIRVNKEFSMSLSPVIRKFVNTNQFNLTTSELFDPNVFQNQLNASGMSAANVYKDGEAPLYIVDLNYDQTHPDIIMRLFNGKEVVYTRENQDFLMYLAQTLKISGLKRSLGNFIKYGESQTVKDLKEIGRLISEFNEETFDDVYNFLLKYLQSDDENAVKQSYFVAFLIFNGCVARPSQMELFIKLVEKLGILNEFTTVCIYNYKDKENLQESLFLIRHLLTKAEEEENQSSQKKKNYLSIANSISNEKKSLIFTDLSRKNVDPKNNNGFSSSDSDDNENEEKKVSMLKIFTENFTPYELSSFKLHKEYADAGINNDPIAVAVRNDDVSIFTDESKANRRVINFANYCVKPSLYERSSVINNSIEDVDDDKNRFLKKGVKYTGIPLVCYAAYFGSIECFKYLVNEVHVEIPSNLTRYAACGGNSEILDFCYKRMKSKAAEENAANQNATDIFNNFFGQPTKKQEEKNENENEQHEEEDAQNKKEHENEEEAKNEKEQQNEEEVKNENEQQNEEEAKNENEQQNEEEVKNENEEEEEEIPEESKVCVFDTRCLELAAIFQRIETFKFLVETAELQITDAVIDVALRHFSFEVFVYILSKPGFDLNSLFLRSAKYSNEEAASLMTEFCDSYDLQEEDTLKTPLHYACENGLSKVVKILIEKVKPNLKLKVNFEDEDEVQSQTNEEEEKANLKTKEEEEEEAQLQIEEEEEEHESNEEEIDKVKTREVKFELDQDEQHEFDEEIQKGLVEQTSSEQVIHPPENAENQQQEEEEINVLERNVDLEPNQDQEPLEEAADQKSDEVEIPQENIEQNEQAQEFEQDNNNQFDEEQIQQQLQQIEEQQLEQIESDNENQPEQQEIEQNNQEPVTLEDDVEIQEQNGEVENNEELPNVQSRDIQLEIEVEEEEPNEQQQQNQPQAQQEEEAANPNLIQQEIEEEEEESTEIMISNNEEESTELNIEINNSNNERTETNDNIESADIVINKSNEEEDILFKNNSLIEGNNELDELESQEAIENDVQLDQHSDEFIEEEENAENHEEQPLITFSPSTTSDEDEFINNISAYNTANTTNVNPSVQRNIYPNLSSNVLSRSIILRQSSIDLNAKDADNVTPLQLACKEGWLNIVRMFAQLDYEDVEYEAVSDYEKTAIQFAEEASHKKIVDLLLKIKEENQSHASENNDDQVIEQAEE